MKRIISVILLLLLLLGLTACGEDEISTVVQTTVQETTAPMADGSELTILYTNDIHAAYLRDEDQGRLGFAALAAYARELEEAGKTVVLIDGGDAIQGETVATLSEGSHIVDMMNELGYLLAVPGNHEFDFGMDVFLELANDRAEYSYVSCNFIDLKTGETVFEPYILKDFGGKLVAFVGISTPESVAKNDIYGFVGGSDGQELYVCVQKAIDDAVSAGADYVIGVGHLGTDPASTPYSSAEVIANTTGMAAFLDAHSHSLIDGLIVKDKDDNDVVLCSAGSNFIAVAELTIDLNSGVVSAKLIHEIEQDDEEILERTDEITEQLEGLLNEVVGFSDVKLVTHDPDNEEERLIRKQETNLGDFCADAYRAVLGADISLVNGGGICAEIKAGEVTCGDVIDIHPFGGYACVVEATGQQIMDALEMAYREAGEGENGGFLHVSGLTCTVDLSVPSPVVVDDKEVFVKVAGERRVKDIMINGEPIVPKKIYTVASPHYLIKYGIDGNTLFTDCKPVKDEAMLDNQVLITYVQQYLNGIIAEEQYGKPNGQGRIAITQSEKTEE